MGSQCCCLCWQTSIREVDDLLVVRHESHFPFDPTPLKHHAIPKSEVKGIQFAGPLGFGDSWFDRAAHAIACNCTGTQMVVLETNSTKLKFLIPNRTSGSNAEIPADVQSGAVFTKFKAFLPGPSSQRMS
eukprot:TRINITY_DN5673_c0_g1_i1.p1 TRINITY_DN5673_c0_g1~~TRINITY_DN5673_c0_g1_i1.p1  ORF type:complete len:130 (-),score=12.01 TRINITY_DN5673_c0_g1_i1:151-540(-)